MEVLYRRHEAQSLTFRQVQPCQVIPCSSVVPVFASERLAHCNLMAEHDPIAVIGFSVKFPQQASNSAAFWDLLTRGGSTRAEVPANRYDGEAFYRPVEQGNKTGTASLCFVISKLHAHSISRLRRNMDTSYPSL